MCTALEVLARAVSTDGWRWKVEWDVQGLEERLEVDMAEGDSCFQEPSQTAGRLGPGREGWSPLRFFVLFYLDGLWFFVF